MSELVDDILDEGDQQDLEKVFVPKSEESSEEIDPLDSREVQIAAGQYAQFVKQIRARAKALKAGSLARVLIAVSEFPYAEKYPKFLKQEEQDLFLLMVSNGKAKAVIADALKDQEKVLEEIAVENVTNQILNKGGL